MRVTLKLDDELRSLIAAAGKGTGLTDTSAIVNAALKALVERDSRQRCGGSGDSASDSNT